jgi:hypothetical protein
MVGNIGRSRITLKSIMVTYTEAELFAMGIKLHGSSQITIQERTFRLVFSFNNKMQDFVTDFCGREKDKGRNYIVIETDSTISVWRQISPIDPDTSGDLEPEPDKTGELIRQKFPEDANLPASLISKCTTILTECIGPIALFLVNDLSAKNPNCQPADFVEALAACIPDPSLAKEFRRKISKII